MENNNMNSPFDAAIEEEVAQAANVSEESEAEQKSSYEDLFNPAEMKLICDYSEKINITESTTVMSYGLASQKKISDFSAAALEGAKSRDFRDVSDMIDGLGGMLTAMDTADMDTHGLLGVFKKNKDKLRSLSSKFEEAEALANRTAVVIEAYRASLAKDITLFDELYELNLNYLKELTMYIAAGKMRLSREKSVTLIKICEYAEKTGEADDLQAALDFAEMCRSFDGRIRELELTRSIALKIAPWIKLLQGNDVVMSSKLQSVLENTIPMWKSHAAAALGIDRGGNTVKMPGGVFDSKFLDSANEELAEVLEEIRQLYAQSVDNRRTAEAELMDIENELKKKLIIVVASEQE